MFHQYADSQSQADIVAPEDIVQIRTYIVDISSERVSAYNEARVGFFTQQNKPASTMVGVPGLVIPELLVEVEAVAVIENQSAGRLSPPDGLSVCWFSPGRRLSCPAPAADTR